MAEGIDINAQLLETILPHVDDTPLADEDLFDVKSELISVVASWKDIGMGFRLGTGKLDAIGTQYPSNPKACLSEVLTKWLKKDYNVKKFGEPTWQWIVKVVAHPAAGSDPALALAIAKKHSNNRPEEEMPKVTQVKGNEATDPHSSGILSDLVSKVKTRLTVVQTIKCSGDTEEKSLTNLIQAELRNFIKTCVQSGIPSEQLKEELSGLYSRELLISESIYKWALQLASDEYSTTSIVTNSPEQESEPPKIQPLFSKETLYHAGLCCCATSTCDAATYKDFFKSEGHSLEEASMSRMRESDQKKIDRYLIARQGKTYYVAFQSKPHLSQWAKEHVSFKEGINSQCEKIPLRFFIEQLRDGYRIVLAGFSFGGLLALAVAASMWKQTLLSADLLKDNLVCITFGLPLISIPLVEETTKECPEFVTTIHSIFLKDDPIPQLLRFLDPVFEDQYTQVLQTLEHSEPATAFLKLACSTNSEFQGPFTSKLLHHLSILQERGLKQVQAIVSPDGNTVGTDTAQNALHNVQLLLKDILPYLTRMQFPTFGKSYVVSVELHTEPWRELVHSEIQLELAQPILPEQMDVAIFQKYKMEIYNRRTFRSYIEQSPLKYNIPPLSAGTISEMKILKPSVQAVAFHRHANELATVVEGENLWFCHQISVGPHKTNTPAQKISRKAILFNFILSDQHNIPTDDDRVKATLSSHFYNPQSKIVPVAHKAYKFTFRQEQLAKLTPSELIEVAYLSTLLEQHSHSQLQCYSDRFRVFREFLQQVVVVVPIESILFTIAATPSDDVALHCVRAMAASKLELQPSLATLDSGGAAVERMQVIYGYIDSMDASHLSAGEFTAGIGEFTDNAVDKLSDAFKLREKAIRKEVKKSVPCTHKSKVSQHPTLLEQSIQRSSWTLSQFFKNPLAVTN